MSADKFDDIPFFPQDADTRDTWPDPPAQPGPNYPGKPQPPATGVL